MMINILITLMSIYLINDFIGGHRLAKQTSVVISFTALLWLIANLTEIFHPYTFQVSICIIIGVKYFLLILSIDTMTFLTERRKKIINLGMFLYWLGHLYLILHVYLWDVFLISDNALALSVLGVGFALFYGVKKSSFSIYPVRILNIFRFETFFILAYLSILIYFFFIANDYLSSPRLVFFYLMYFLFFVPNYFLHPIRCLYLYLKSVIMAGLFLILTGLLYVGLTLIGYPDLNSPFQWLFFYCNISGFCRIFLCS